MGVSLLARMFRGRGQEPPAQPVVVGPHVRIVTDSTACLPPSPARVPGEPEGFGLPEGIGLSDATVAAAAAEASDATAIAAVTAVPGVAVVAGVTVVPLHVIRSQPSSQAGGPAQVDTWREGVDIGPDQVAQFIARGDHLTTSQPASQDFLNTYSDLARSGARAIVSVHLSGALSGTVESARHAAQRASIPVLVVDSRSAAMGLGFAVQAAAQAAAQGLPAVDVAARASQLAASSRSLFLVDSLEHLRRGGRLSLTAATLGAALGVKPLLTVDEHGGIAQAARVRTRSLAVTRLIDLSARQASRMLEPVVAVHHMGAPDRAAEVCARFEALTGIAPLSSPLSAALGVHTGPGTLAIVVADQAS